MKRGIYISNSKNVIISNISIYGFDIGLEIGKYSHVKLRHVKIGSCRCPLIIREFSSIEIDGDDGVILNDGY